ncbi:hypothetical protein ABIB51_004446 [Arthrobacter sp. UYCu712]
MATVPCPRAIWPYELVQTTPEDDTVAAGFRGTVIARLMGRWSPCGQEKRPRWYCGDRAHLSRR